MDKQGDITKLRSSWTKYDCVQFIDIIGDNDLDSYLTEEKGMDIPVLRSYLGIRDLEDQVPSYWRDIQKYPNQKKLFALVAGIFTHYDNILMFAEEFSKSNMTGLFKIGDGGKHMTNLRSALVVSGAAKNSYRRRDEVPYDLSDLYEEGDVGTFFRQLLFDRLRRVGYGSDYIEHNFIKISHDFNFHKALSLTKEQFKRWTEGKKISPVKPFGYDLEQLAPSRKVPAMRINQWLSSWNGIEFGEPMRTEPDHNFYVFSMDIRLLKRLSEVHRRRANKRRVEDTSVQRAHDEKRSQEIQRYVEGGFPWSTLSDTDKSSDQYKHLRMPGILPTAFVANVLGPGQKRGQAKIDDSDLIKIINAESNNPYLLIPEAVFDPNWDPELKPLEIIDGQHRLMAFDETRPIDGNYEVPVVAYYNLDRTWQAYLFYVINIKPKKINTSLGYDLYPLLRTQDWLENSRDGLAVYRETRAQELVEALWLYEQSPWYNRINMLGTNEGGNISQAAFVRALTSSYLRRTTRKNVSGLFADVLPGKNYEEIKWVRAQQAAFLILLWEQIALKAYESTEEWAIALRAEKKQMVLFDALDKKNSILKIDDTFLSRNSMLSRDQGVTGISMFSNDFFFVAANYFSDYDFNSIEWKGDIDERQIETDSIDTAIKQFRNNDLHLLINGFSTELMKLDWRMPSAQFKDVVKQDLQKKYKGSGGYRELWQDLVKLFKESDNEHMKQYAIELDKLSGNQPYLP